MLLKNIEATKTKSLRILEAKRWSWRRDWQVCGDVRASAPWSQRLVGALDRVSEDVELSTIHQHLRNVHTHLNSGRKYTFSQVHTKHVKTGSVLDQKANLSRFNRIEII